MVELEPERFLASVQGQLASISDLITFGNMISRRSTWPEEREGAPVINLGDSGDLATVHSIHMASPLITVMGMAPVSVPTLLLIWQRYEALRVKHAKANTAVEVEKYKQDRVAMLREELAVRNKLKNGEPLIEQTADALPAFDSIEPLEPLDLP
jgi:hypothetical protein